jgi:5-oxoprolinase (ATP-hydrolysing)/N-methylhydantoinase B
MRLSKNGYYVEKYVKCDNCGLLIYDQGISVERDGKALLFCSDWCIEWSRLRQSGEDYFQLKIVQPTIKTSR